MQELEKDPLSTPAEDLSRLQHYLNQRIVGQPNLNLRLLIALLANGHLLVEGAPGLAKTTSVKTLAAGLEGEFHRIQFTPDLLPADLTGTDVYRPQDGSFQFQPGPIFHNLLLADEINRAPAKVQSALLETMAENQVTIGRTSYELPRLFMVMATQNPIEQEGTYPLPEAQLDRFLIHVRIDYPNLEDEHIIMNTVRKEARNEYRDFRIDMQPVSQQSVFTARHEVLSIHMAPALESYIVQLIGATRDPTRYNKDFDQWVRFGASPRGTIALDRCSRAHAWLHGRDYVNPEDVQAIAHDVMRHRILLSFEAEADGITSDQLVTELLARVPAP